MALNISGLSESLKNYVDGSRETLISNVIFSEDVLQFFNLQTGCKTTSPIILLDQTIEFGDGTTCKFEDGGATNFTDRMITIGAVKVNKSFCDKVLLKTALASELSLAAGTEKMPFEEKITSDLVDKINVEKNRQLFIGKTESGDKIDGIVTLIEKGVADGTITNVVDMASDPIDVRVEKLWKSIKPEHSDAEIFMSVSNFKDLVLKFEKDNKFHYDIKENMGDMELVLPYANTKVHGIVAMGTNNTVWASPKWNLFYGTDGESDNESYDLWYSKDNQEFRLAVNFVFGCNYAFGSAIYVNGQPMA